MAPPRILITRSLHLYRLSSFIPPPLTASSPLRLPSTSLIPLPSSPLRLTSTPFHLSPITLPRVHFPAPVFFSTATTPDQEEAVSPPTPLTTDGESEWSDEEGEEFTNVFEMIKRKLPLPDSWPDFKKQAYESRIGIERFSVAKGYLKAKPIPKKAPSDTDLLIRILQEVKQRMPMPPVNSRRRQSSFATRLKNKRQSGDNKL